MRKIKLKFINHLTLAAAFFINHHAFAADDYSATVNWNYKGKTGPTHWGTLDPHFEVCSKGKLQSPIDIPKTKQLSSDKLSFNYEAAPLTIMDDGTTEVMIGKTPTILNDGHTIQLNFPQAQETITFNDKKYKLIQFHLHTPSENKLHGKSFPLELHFVHQGENGTLAVVGVFAKLGETNTIFEKIVAHMPKVEAKALTIQGEQINPIDLLPSTRSFYHFTGSLTTPPCAEGISWIVMDQPITISASQLEKIRTATEDNARPTQPLNKRTVSYTRAAT